MINAKRDQKAAVAAVDMALQGKKPAIAVDDDICLEAMLKRVLKIVEAEVGDKGYRVERSKPGVHVRLLNGGYIYIFSADKFVGKPGN
jgi:hypothetical protein